MAANQYHGSAIDWRQSKNLEGNYVGLEIETHNEGGLEKTVNAVEEANDHYLNQAIVCEHDATLDRYNGIEVITPPIKLAQAIRAGGFVNRLVDTLKASGVTENPAANYGMHININCKEWTEQGKHLLTFWIYMLEKLCKKVGGRAHEANYGYGYWNLRVSLQPQGFTVIQQKHTPAWLRYNNPNVIEVRYPKAVVDFESIKTNISFIFSIKAFIETKEAQWLAHYLATIAPDIVGRDIKFVEFNKEPCVEVYLAWLETQRNFKKLFATLATKSTLNKTLTLTEVKEYAQKAYPAGAAVQKQAIERSDQLTK